MEHKLKDFISYAKFQKDENIWRTYESRAHHSLITSLSLYLLVILIFIALNLDITSLVKIPILWMGIMVSAGASFFYRSFKINRNLSRRSRLDSAQSLLEDPRDPILYLRPFSEDATDASLPNVWSWVLASINFTADRGRMAEMARNINQRRSTEELLVSALHDIGPVVAVGRPSEDLPQLGAVRFYFEDSEWQEKVLALAALSRLVVIQAGSSAGVEWEMENIFKLRLNHVLISFVSWLRLSRKARQINYEIVGEMYKKVHGKLTSVEDFKWPKRIGGAYFMEIDHSFKPTLVQPVWGQMPFLLLQPAVRIRETLILILKKRGIEYERNIFRSWGFRYLLFLLGLTFVVLIYDHIAY